MAKLKEIRAAIDAEIALDAAKTDFTDQQWADWFATELDEAVSAVGKTEALEAFDASELLGITGNELETLKVVLDTDQVPVTLLADTVTALSATTTKTNAALAIKKTKKIRRDEKMKLGKVRPGDVQRANLQGGA